MCVRAIVREGITRAFLGFGLGFGLLVVGSGLERGGGILGGCERPLGLLSLVLLLLKARFGFGYWYWCWCC